MIILSPFFLVLPALGFVFITRPSAYVSLFASSFEYVNPASSRILAASSYVFPTTSGTVTSSTSWVNTSQLTPPVINNSKKNEVKATKIVFFFFGSSYSYSSSSSVSSNSSSSSKFSLIS